MILLLLVFILNIIPLAGRLRKRKTVDRRKLAANELRGERETPETIAVSGGEKHRQEISAWRTEERDERPSDRTSFFPSFWGHGS